MYNKETKQGWNIVSKFENSKGTFVVVKRDNDFAWGSFYNEETGNWAQGHYDYSSQKQAEEDMISFALNINIIPSDEKGLNEALKDFAIKEAKQDKAFDINEPDFDAFLQDFHQDFEWEFHQAYEIYKQELEN